MTDILCMLAPNGARKTERDHPGIPITTDEICRTAREAAEAGASALHLHVRDEHGRHSLDPDHYAQALKAIADGCGKDFVVQVSTEAGGVYEVGDQIRLVTDLCPRAVSLSVRELGRAEPRELTTLDGFIRDHDILAQWILYDEEDARLLRQWMEERTLNARAYPVLAVLGGQKGTPLSEFDSLRRTFLEDSAVVSSWMICVFGHREGELLDRAIDSGGHVRVGFENNTWRAEGQPAESNIAQLTRVIESLRRRHLRVANSAMTQKLLRPRWT